MGILIEIGYIFGVALLELFSSLFIIMGIFQCKLKKGSFTYLLPIVMIVIITAWFVISGNQNNLPPIAFLAEMIIILLYIDERLVKKTTLYLIAYIISYIINIFIIAILSLIFSVDESFIPDNFFWRVLTMTINICFVLLLAIIISKGKKEIIYWIRNLSLYYFLIALPGLFCCAVVLAFVQIGRLNSINEIWDKIALFSGSLVCICFVVGTVSLILLNDSRKHYLMQNLLKDKYMNMQQSYYDIILKNDKEIRGFKHDIKSHIGCMLILSELKNYDELIKYISEFSNQVDYLLIRDYCSGNDIVDAVINYMALEAEKDDITINLEGILAKSLKIAGVDLCTIFSNTISNAIEACRLIASKEMRRIDIKFSNYQDTLIIIIENPVHQSVDLSLLGEYTTKKDDRNHGFGIQNIRDAVNKNHGDVKFINQDDKFKVEIVLQNIL